MKEETSHKKKTEENNFHVLMLVFFVLTAKIFIIKEYINNHMVKIEKDQRMKKKSDIINGIMIKWIHFLNIYIYRPLSLMEFWL